MIAITALKVIAAINAMTFSSPTDSELPASGLFCPHDNRGNFQLPDRDCRLSLLEQLQPSDSDVQIR
jgi:hypothetical protein